MIRFRLLQQERYLDCGFPERKVFLKNPFLKFLNTYDVQGEGSLVEKKTSNLQFPVSGAKYATPIPEELLYVIKPSTQRQLLQRATTHHPVYTTHNAQRIAQKLTTVFPRRDDIISRGGWGAGRCFSPVSNRHTGTVAVLSLLKEVSV